jgi:hypothetical protein
VIVDAIYAAAERSRWDRPTASDNDVARAHRIICRFLEELPGELCVRDMRAELEQPE